MSSQIAEANRTPLDRALALLILGVLAVAPACAVLASRSPTALIVVIGVLAIPLVLRTKLMDGLDQPMLGLVAGIVVVMAATSALAPVDPPFSLERTAKSAGLILAGVLGAAVVVRNAVFSSATAKTTLQIAVGVAVALLALELMADGPIYRLGRGMGSTDLIETWAFDRSALVLLVMVWPAIACLPGRWPLAASVIASAILFALVTLTESQTGPLVILAAVLAFWAVLIAPRIAAMAIGGATALYVALAPWLFPAIYEEAAARFGDWTAASAGARLDIWRVVAQMAQERLLTGWGADTLRQMDNIFSPAESFMTAAGYTAAFHPHNFALQVWFDLGIVGVALVISLILLVFWRISALDRTFAAAGCAMITAMIVAGSLSPGLWQGWWIGAIALAVCQFIVATRTRGSFAIDQIGARPD